jgi:hypothetical protein
VEEEQQVQRSDEDANTVEEVSSPQIEEAPLKDDTAAEDLVEDAATETLTHVDTNTTTVKGERDGSPGLSDAVSSYEDLEYSQEYQSYRGGDNDANQASSSTGRFEDTLADFQPPKRYVKEEKAPAAAHAVPSTFIMGGAGDNMCRVCQKRVYEMEKIIADNKIYHKTCFKCHHCNRVLSLGNFAGIDGQLYCKPHFIAMFKTKGNYDEGFGRERHSRNWQNRESAVVVPSTEAGLQQPRGDEAEADQRHIVRSGEEAEDLPAEGLPSIRSIKSRFEGSTAQQQSSQYENGDDEPPRDPDVVRETREKEEVHFTELNSVRSRFESSSSSQGASQRSPSPQKTSKWEVAPKSPQPVAVSEPHYEPPREENELPPPGTSRQLASRFRELESSAPAEPQRKAVRKMTPPQDEIQRDVQQYQEAAAEAEDELPPPGTSRSIRSKFESSPKSAVDAKRFRSSPDSGISDTETSVPATRTNGYQNGGDAVINQEGVIRESDKNIEEELPERGFTKSLLAQWQTKLGESPGPKKPVSRKADTGGPVGRSWSYRDKRGSEETQARPEVARSVSSSHSQQADEADGGRDVVREADTHEEDFLPPPSYTKNMLAKFQSLEAQAKQEPTPRLKHKQFKWQVKEVQPFNRPSSQPRPATTQEQDNAEHEADDERVRSASKYEPDGASTYPNEREQPDGDEYDDQHQEYSSKYDLGEGGEFENEPPQHDPSVVREADRHDEEELPEQGTTRNLLAKFKALQANTA